jgi:hypothetical protein
MNFCESAMSVSGVPGMTAFVLNHDISATMKRKSALTGSPMPIPQTKSEGLPNVARWSLPAG